IAVNGSPVGSSAARAAVSFVPDDPVLYDDLSVREHLSYIAALHGVDASADDVDAIIDRFGLLHRADDLPARFSRALRQKTSTARTSSSATTSRRTTRTSCTAPAEACSARCCRCSSQARRMSEWRPTT